MFRQPGDKAKRMRMRFDQLSEDSKQAARRVLSELLLKNNASAEKIAQAFTDMELFENSPLRYEEAKPCGGGNNQAS
ncbi:hypothetical protein I4A95_004051 [Enterobacter hormaechei]|uniref:hypothetical protein n=2 Tax=Enterobacterales TaxID=91347 RepID=UPI0013D67614|nr:hypothetical protein [Enterobacter hormaechei]MCU3033129.1 hypothetical protein [Enterobacter hormaechei subsp. hoffmannii]EHN8769381.1 hypothetical protein [Enterobacter hormaechei]EHN8781506.1 hypothetical protein [Enterobacter hormaechei]EHN8897124.1 hypothetical protein [Enterobacter hormaechei]EKS6327607.1 hypothetical protein [Enterobacter hormaechei]